MNLITYWNRGAQELFGWTPEQAIGKPADELFLTIFPGPVKEIREELRLRGRWDSELTKTKADGTKIVVSSRWSLQRDPQNHCKAILETNHDISLSLVRVLGWMWMAA